ncbi:MAG: EAL domain-containing protein [Novosphingobium sp.]
MFKRLSAFRGAPASSVAPRVLNVEEEREAIALLRDYESSGLGWFWASDGQGSLTYVSDCVAEALGKVAADLLGQPVTALFHANQDSHIETMRTLPLLLASRKKFHHCNLRARVDHDDIWWAVSGRPQFDAEGKFIGFRGNGIDVTESLRERRDTSRLARSDSLTGLANRHTMEFKLDSIITAYKASQRSCAMLIIDLDRFKHVNDTLGHPVGDALLKQVAERLRGVIGNEGEIGRLGGDEFQVILPDCDDRGKLGDIAKRLIGLVSQPYAIDQARCVIGASVGIAIAPFDGATTEELMRNADLALYAAKHGGRGTFRFFSIELQNAAEKRRVLEQDLRSALADGQIRLAYQPVVNAEAHTVDSLDSLEALMRWEHPDFGELPPSLFIPIAEESSLIVPLGEWAIRQACSDAAQWPGNASVSVNISPQQFVNSGFVNSVVQALAESELAPSRLELEFTESIFATNEVLARDTFAELRQIGVRVSLDNFGSGNSPIAYLRQSHFDKIKIDQSITQDLTHPGSRCTAIAAAIVTLAKQLGMVTVAGGIETNEELRAMAALGIDQIQGFIYSAACSAEEVLDALGTGQWVIEPDGPMNNRPDRRSVYRRVGVIHEDFRYDVIMRNLSRAGAAVEGLFDVPLETQFVVDLGEGQLVVSTVRRSEGALQGLEFEMSLVDDGAGGLVTRHRVPRHLLEAMGMPTGASAAGVIALNTSGGINLPKFAMADSQSKIGRAA